MRFSLLENNPDAGTRNRSVKIIQRVRRSERVDSPVGSANGADHVKSVANSAADAIGPGSAGNKNQDVLPDAIWPEPAPLSSARARRAASVVQPSEVESARVFADFAVKIGMTEDSLRSNPTQGMTQLFRYFGPAFSRYEAPSTLSVHPVFLRRSDFAAWQEIFGLTSASAQEQGGQGNAPLDLQMAVQDLALELLQLRHGGQTAFYKMCRGVFSSSLRQGRELTAVREALANELLAMPSVDVLDAMQARWCAQLILCRHEPSLGRMDAPTTLVFGSPQQLHRHLAIIDRTAFHKAHWALPERTLLAETPPPNAPPAEIGYAALRFAYAQRRDYLLSALAKRSGGIDPAITAYAVEDLRKSLRSAGIADRLLPPGAAGLETLPEDWIDRLDWVAFNGPGFLLAHGTTLPYRNTLAWWLRAIDDCFAPGDTFNVREMDQQKRNLFVDKIADSQAFGTSPGADWDPGFAQSLFSAFLRRYVLPLAEAPFERALCRATEPLPFLRCDDPAVSPGLRQILRSIDEVKDGLRRELFKDGDLHLSKERQQWAVRFLCSIFAPALAVDLPGQTGYGSVGYTGVELALFYPGIPLGNLTMDVSRELLASGVTAEIMALADSEQPGASPIRTIVRRMAHAGGAIDGQEPMTASAWEKATAYFENQMQAAGQDDALNTTESVIAEAIGNRTRSVMTVLEEMGCNPRETFTIPASPFAYLNMFISTPLAFGKPHTLYEIVLEEALPQLLAYGDLSERQRGMLLTIRDRWPKEALLRRCRSDFDASLAGLISAKIMPALQRLVQALPADQQRIVQCGEATIRLPRVTALVRNRPGAIPDQRSEQKANVIASGAVLLDLKLGDETLHLMVSLRPLGLLPYTCSEEELIKEYMPIFFQPGLPGAPNAPGRRIVRVESIRNFYTYTPRDGQGVLEAIIGHVFSEEKIEALYQLVIGETDSERSAAAVRDFILGMVPGYGCSEALTTPGQLQGASFTCLLDVAGAVPVARIGSRSLTKIMRIAQRAILAEMTDFSAAQLGIARRDIGRALAMGAEEAYQVALKAGKKTLGYLDPGVFDILTFWRLGKSALVLIKKSIMKFADLHGLRDKIDRIIRMSDAVFPERGMWRVKPEMHRTDAAGNPYVRLDRRYEVADLDDMPGVLVIPDGPGRVRPVDPESGLPCGFSRRRGGMARSSKPPGRPAEAATGPALCRPKRSPGNMHAICTMEPAPHMGDDYYIVPTSSGPQLHQALPSRPGHLLEIDPGSAVYRSYTDNGGERVASNIFLHDSVLYRRLNNGRLFIVDAGLDTGNYLLGRLSHDRVLPKTGNARDKAWYVRTEVEVDLSGRGDGKVRLICKTPHGDFADADGQLLRMVNLYGDGWYVFKAHGALRRNQIVELTKATDKQVSIYTTYGVINSFDYPPRIKNSILRLYDEPLYRSAVDTALTRFDVMLENAELYYSSLASNRFLRKFVADEDPILAEQFRRKMLDNIGKLKERMPYVKEHKDYLIGIADLEEKLAVSLNGAMADPLDPAFLNKPVLLINWIQASLESPEVLARILGHEFMHTILKALDSMKPGSKVDFYATLKPDGRVDLSMLRFGAQVPGLDPSICASMLEHCLSVGDGMARGAPGFKDVAEGDSNVYKGDGGRRHRRQRQSNALSSDGTIWSSSQIEDVDDLSYMLIANFPPDRRDGVKKKS